MGGPVQSQCPHKVQCRNTDTRTQTAPGQVCCSPNSFIASITFNSLPSVSASVFVRVVISEYDGIHRSGSILLCLLQKNRPRSSFCVRECWVPNTHVKKWVSMMHQRGLRVTFHPPGASTALFIWLLGCSVNDISSTITLKCVQDTDPPPHSEPPPPPSFPAPLSLTHKVQGLAFLSQDVFIIWWYTSRAPPLWRNIFKSLLEHGRLHTFDIGGGFVDLFCMYVSQMDLLE